MWSRNYGSCHGCGRTDRRHMAKGECSACYLRQYQKEHFDAIRIKKHAWYSKFVKGTERQKIAREIAHFNGKRGEVLQRDNYQCVRCGACKALVVHHRDGLGRGIKVPNNDIGNLETLCRKCYMQEHRVTSFKRVKTHCSGGHPYSQENTYIVPSKGWRRCRFCANARAREYQKRKKSMASSTR